MVSDTSSRLRVDTRGPGLAPPSNSVLRGRHAGRAVRDAGPRALVVGARPARARADEARAPAAPVPRQVHPAARRDSARPLLRAGRARARPVRRLRDDARAGARVRTRRDRRRARRVQLPPDPRQDGALRRRRSRRGAARRLQPDRVARSRTGARAARAVPPRVVLAAGGRRAVRVPRPDRHVRASRRPARDPVARRALLAPCRALRSRGAARAADRRVLVLQASPHVPSGRVRGRLSPPLHARHADAHRGVRARARRRARGATSSTPTRATSTTR